MEGPALPTKFPCWVKAVYSFGGETKRDLGFLEGDYIECLNAGDGSWWTGRLKRDPRMVGKFPSNFVKVLDTTFQPATRNASPLPLRNDSTPPSSGQNTPTNAKKKSGFRRPFSAHAAAGAPNPRAAARDIQSRSSTPVSKKTTTRPYSSMKKPEPANALLSPEPARPPSPKIPQPIPRGGTYRPPPPPKQPDPVQHRQSIVSRPHHVPSRAPSPMMEQYAESETAPDSSPPPPPPPAHRVAYTRHPSFEDPPAPAPPERSHTPYRPTRTPSPAPSAHTGFTPSPLRDAMNDVISSLEGMGTESRHRSEEAEAEGEATEAQVDMWSPEAFDQIYHSARGARPNTSLGFEEPNDSHAYVDEHPMEPAQDYDEQLSSYVSRMERRLDELHRTGSLAESNLEPPKHHVQYTNQAHPSRAPSSRASSRPGSGHAHQAQNGASSTDRSRPPSRISSIGRALSRRGLRERKSAYELGRDRLARTFTSKSSATTASSTAQSSSTNNSNGTSATSQSLMSGYSAGGFSATSAGSFARRKFILGGSDRPQSVAEVQRPGTAMSSISYHSSQASNARAELSNSQGQSIHPDQSGIFGGLAIPVSKKRGIFQRIKDTARTSAASHRSSMGADSGKEGLSRPKSMLDGLTSMSGGKPPRSAARDMGLGGGDSGVDWMQMRRDVNRSNSLSKNERNERAERCQMLDIPVLNPVDILNETAEGDESADGYPVTDPTDFLSINLALVDKSARFVTNLPGMINATSLAQTYLCRQYRSDVQRLRAIFTWVAERVSWEDDFEGSVDARRVIVSRRGCSEEIAVLVAEMCLAVGLQAEVIRGYLKAPGEVFTMQGLSEAAAHPNHWWNAVLVEGEWRMMDCSLASPSNPRRSAYSSAGNQVADSWYFLARPTEFCYTHVPLLPEQQHIVPSLSHDVLLALPVACPAFFKNSCGMWDYDTSLLYIEKLEMAHIQMAVPDDVELFAEVEAQSFARDSDGDYFESGDCCKKRALAQAEYLTLPNDSTPVKRYTIKAVLPSSSNSGPRGVLQIYAGKRGLMHGLHKNPHALAMTLPLAHDGGENPQYDFFLRHPTPHALRHELYVSGPLCRNLAVNNTFVFCVRQHPSTLAKSGPESARPVSPSRPASALSIARPSSALSMASVSVSGSGYSNPSNASGTSDGSDAWRNGSTKPAKLAIQSPSGKIMRMTRKVNGVGHKGEDGEAQKAGSCWETIIKIGERGTWRGLVLADRSARWCVFGEWEAK